MYGFGDDRNPANDTVNVMEEILIEYIADVVGSRLLIFVCSVPEFTCSTVSTSSRSIQENASVY